MSLIFNIPEDHAATVMLQLYNVLSKTRIYRRRFEETHTAQDNAVMKQWEARADQLLDEIKQQYTDTKTFVDDGK